MTNQEKQKQKAPASTDKHKTARRQKKDTTQETLKSKQKNKAKTEYTIGGRISLLRQAAGMSQEQLAEALDISCYRICRIEGDKQEPYCSEFVKMCDLFGTTTDYIIRGIENPPANLDLTPDEKTLIVSLLEKLKTC